MLVAALLAVVVVARTVAALLALLVAVVVTRTIAALLTLATLLLERAAEAFGTEAAVFARGAAVARAVAAVGILLRGADALTLRTCFSIAVLSAC